MSLSPEQTKGLFAMLSVGGLAGYFSPGGFLEI